MSLQKTLIGGIIGVAAVAGGGWYYYGGGASSAPVSEEIFVEAFQQGVAVESFSLEGQVQATVSEVPDTNGTVTLGLKGNLTDLQTKPNSDLKLQIDAKVNVAGLDYNGSGTLETRMIGDAPYIRLSDVELPPMLALQAGPIVEQFSNQWYALPADTVSGTVNNSPMSPELRAAFIEHNPLVMTKSLGSKGGSAGALFALDTTKLEALLTAAAKLDPQAEISESDLDAFKQMIDAAQPYIELWVDEDTHQTTKSIIRFTLTDPAGVEPGKLKVESNLGFSNYNSVPAISAPADAVEFDPAMLGL
jgi:hypothetical protein